VCSSSSFQELCANPRFFSESRETYISSGAKTGGSVGAESGLGYGPTRVAGVEKGDFGDTWLMTALSALALTPQLLARVVPPDQYFDHTYCGMFRFQLWHFGEWVEVIIDDRLPTTKGRLLGLHSADPSEFWVSLLEKAYAK
jgi:hypothetical protein